mmetsp:Transcript_3739/g.8991  ORF Transcript_3739/g.8991 Transcript_3739/m.8991 type:complete len:93 (-) Transcript_3739:1664-1942(-)
MAHQTMDPSPYAALGLLFTQRKDVGSECGVSSGKYKEIEKEIDELVNISMNGKSYDQLKDLRIYQTESSARKSNINVVQENQYQDGTCEKNL